MDDRVLVAHMVAYIEGHLVEPIGTEDLVAKSGYSLNRLRQKFYTVTGDTPSGYLRKRRLTEAAKEILGGARIADAALKYGYSSQDNFTTAFRSYFGVTPAEIARIEDRYRRFIRRMREAYTIMEIANLKQPPFSVTLMGCIKGAADYFDTDLSAAMLYGLSGHAFLVNIHKDMCPSSPYVWSKSRFHELCAGLGVRIVAEYQVARDTSPDERRAVEEKLKRHLNDGQLCMLDFLEHQLIGGYDEVGFTALRPWGMADSEVAAISFGSWTPCLEKEGWAHVTVLAKSAPRAVLPDAARDALSYAMDLWDHPERYEAKDYRVGPGAYEHWIEALRRGLGTGHGHWWCGMVWSECRRMAADFFSELSEMVEPGAGKTLARDLAVRYRGMADALGAAKERNLAAEEQIRLVGEARDAELGARGQIEDLVRAI